MLLVWICVAAVIVSGQTPSPEATTKITEITAQFQAAYDRDVGNPHTAALDALDIKYIGAMKRSLDAATQAGNLDEALKLREEISRVIKKEALPPVDIDSLPASLKQLRTTYRTMLAKLEQERDAKAQPFYDHYDKLLEALQTDLTKAKLIDDAIAVKAKRDSVALDRPKVIVPEAAVAMPEEAPSEKKSTSAVVQKGSPWRMAAEWALSLKAKLQIEKDGQRGIEKVEQLPAGKFDILSIEFSRYYPHDGKKINEVDLALLNPIAKTLEKLILEQCNITGSGLEAIAGAPKLRMLSLQESPVTDDAMKHLSGLLALESLHINGPKMDGTGLAHLRALPKLKELNLNASTLSEAGGQALSMLTNLEKLRGGTGDFKGDGLTFTRHLASLVNLRELSFGDTAPITDACLEPLKGLTQLERINFNNSLISGVGVIHLKASAATLKNISLWYRCPVTDEALEVIASTLPNLEYLGIGYGGICGVDGLRSLAKLGKLQHLVWSSKTPLAPADYALFANLPQMDRLGMVDSKGFDEAGLVQLAANKKIKELNLEGTNLTDVGLNHLKAMKSLQSLIVKRTQVSAPGLAAFSKARPEVKVEK